MKKGNRYLAKKKIKRMFKNKWARNKAFALHIFNKMSIKKDWVTKNKEEAFAMRLQNSCIAFNFGPGQPNYYVINESLMQQLVEYLEESLK